MSIREERLQEEDVLLLYAIHKDGSIVQVRIEVIEVSQQ